MTGLAVRPNAPEVPTSLQKAQPFVNQFLRVVSRETTPAPMTHSGLLQKDPNGGWSSPGVAVSITPARTPCFFSFVVHFAAQQKLVQHLLGTDSSGVLLVLFSLERDALKACRYVADQVLSVV